MKSSGKIVTIGLIILGLNLVAAVLFDQVVTPLLLPLGSKLSQEELTTLQHGSSLACFVVGIVVSSLTALLYSRLGTSDAHQDIIDSIARPLFIIDSNDRYVLFNREAERVFGVSRERDIGKPLAQEIAACITGPRMAGVGDQQPLIHKGEHTYEATAHLLPETRNGQERRRIVIVDGCEDTLRVRGAMSELDKQLAVLGADTKRITGASHSLFDGASRQAVSLSQITGSLDEFSRRLQGNTEAASKGTQLAAQAREAAERSGNEIANALSAMTDVQDAGVRIARIVKLIDDIAFQTNLLALNAAVEAARAGRQGKGFAVVADEVRNLAGRSAKAAKDTAVMVEDVTERIGNASAYISRLEDMLRNIMQDAVRLADSSQAASEISVEQATTILQVNRELGEMNDLTQRTRSEAERTLSAVDDLARTIDELRGNFSSPKKALASGPVKQDDFFELNYNNKAEPDLFQSQSSPPPAFSPAYSRELSSKWRKKDKDSEFSFSMPSKSKPRPEEAIPLPESDTSFTPGTDDSFSEEDFVAPFKRMAALRDLQESASQSPTEYTTNKEGDRVVKPGQSIQLDDKEFGRY